MSSEAMTVNDITDHARRDADPREFYTRNIVAGSYSWNVTSMGNAPIACVLLHGTGSSSHSWHDLMQPLAERFTVVALDLPGHANTSCENRPDLSLRGIASAVTGLLQHMKLNTHSIIGHSAGAAIGAQMLIDKPDSYQRLVSINGALVPLGGLPGLVFSPIAKISANLPFLTDLFGSRLRDPKAVDKLLKNTGSNISQESTNQYRALCKNTDHVSGALQMMASWRLEPLFQMLSTIHVPVQLIAGANDAMIPARDAYRLNRLFPNSELTMLPNLGHLAHEEAPEIIAELILKGDV